MRRFLPLALALVAGCGTEEPKDISVAKQQIWDTVKKYYDALNKADIDAMAALYTDDSSLKRTDDIVHGKDAVVEAFKAAIADNKRRGLEGKRQILVGNENINVTRDVAVVTFVANVNDPGETLKALVTMIFRRQDGKWLIAHLHETWAKK